ncbi:hypothetical protein [Phenylobacterium sp.]|jgi:hypothetical protein|uniref:hypothetical protein n=1 Tax=Phenylobacterium sp. TaxID=1871053 RepID=UPI002F40B6D4
MNDDTPTYCGQPPNQGELSPHLFEGEGFATLQCGGTTVSLGYGALHLITGWLAIGAHGYGRQHISGPINHAFQAITCEAMIASRREGDA